MADLSSIDKILKTQYLGPIRDQVNNANIIASRIKRDSESVVGKNFTMPLHVGRNEGIGARGENGTLPTAGSQQYAETIVPMKYLYGTITLSGPSIKASQNNQGAFARVINSEMEGLAKDLQRDMNRQLWGDGTGLLATCAAASSVNIIPVDSTKFLRVGMTVDVLLIADGTVLASARKITSIVLNTSITIDGTAITTTAGHGVFNTGSRNFEMMGFKGIFSNSSILQTINPATPGNEFWKANIMTAGANRAISETLLQQALDTAETNSNGKATAMYTSYGVRRAYQALLTALKQYVNPMELKGGYKALDYNGLPLIPDKDAPSNAIYMPDEKELTIFRLADFDWMDQDGAALHRAAGKDAYEATMFGYMELGTSMRNAMVLLDKITEG